MASSGRGYLLILNVAVGRTGSEVDTENLFKTFTNMGAQVDVLDNPNKTDVKKKMKELWEMDFTDYLYVAIAYFSHGTEDDVVITANNTELINIQKSLLIPICNNKTLDGKLKWLILQHCRGSYDFAKLKSEGPKPLIMFPRYYAKCFATSPCMKAYRTEYGSFFIDALCYRLRTEYKDLDLMSIMENVKFDVEEECKKTKKIDFIQKPEVETNLSGKKFYITRGFEDD